MLDLYHPGLEHYRQGSLFFHKLIKVFGRPHGFPLYSICIHNRGNLSRDLRLTYTNIADIEVHLDK